MTLTAAYGLLAHALLFGALCASLPFGVLRARAGLMATALALLAGIAPALHGIFGAPSLSAVILAVCVLANSPALNQAARQFNDVRVCAGLMAFALLFYPPSLGGGAFDPYALGYQPWAILAASVPLAATLFYRRHSFWLMVLSLDIAAWGLGLFANLWDALFCIPLALFAAARLLQYGIARLLLWREQRRLS